MQTKPSFLMSGFALNNVFGLNINKPEDMFLVTPDGIKPYNHEPTKENPQND